MSKLLLGVDIGASNIKVIGLKEKKDGFVVSHVLIAPTPPSVYVEGAVIDHGALAKAVHDLVRSAKGTEKDAAFALKGNDVIVKKVHLPWNGKGNFTEEFLWSAEQYIGLSTEKATFDAQLLRFDPERQSAEAVVAAAPKDKVADLLNVASQAGLNPVVMDIEALALVNLVTKLKGSQKHVNAVIDIGYDEVRVIFFENGVVDMIKTLPKGGKSLAEELASDMDSDPEKAEAIIRSSESMSTDADAQAAAMAYGNSLGSEIETLVDIYMQERSKEPVDFFVCGAVSYVAEVVENIETSMGVGVTHIDPFKYIELPDTLRGVIDDCGAGTFALATGLAMRKA
jgi:type IV pilus assembly protein PilM